MSNLKNMNESFTLVGEAFINKDTKKYISEVALGKNGWMRKRLNLGVKISNTNMTYVTMEAGYWNEETVQATKNESGVDERGKAKKKQNWIYNGDMVDGKYVANNIPFDERFNQEQIDKVPYFKRIRVAIEPETVIQMVENEETHEQKEVVQVKKDENGNAICKQKEFLFIGDAIDYIQKHLQPNQRIYVYGNVEINQYLNSTTNQLMTKFNKVISQIRLAKEDEVNIAEGTTNFYFEKDGFDKSEFSKTKKYDIIGHRTYKNSEKNMIPVPCQYVLDFSSPKIDWEDEDTKAKIDYLTEIFTSAKKDKVYSMQWKYFLFEGTTEVELTEKDLSKDLKMRVKLNIIDLEDALKQMRGNSVGDRIKEHKLRFPVGEFDKVEIEDLTIDDLIPPVIENKVKDIAKKQEETVADTKKDEAIKSFDALFS